MKMNTFSHNDIELRYIYLAPKISADFKKMVVVVSNPLNKDGHVDFLFTLSGFTGIHRLLIPNDRELGGRGIFLIKDKEWKIRDAIIELIEKYRQENNIGVSDVYITAFCGACAPAFIISLEKGYSAILSTFSAEKPRLEEWRSEDRRIEDFLTRWRQLREPQGHVYFTAESVGEYTGLSFDEIKFLLVNYIKRLPPEKFLAPKLYLHYGRYEERYVIDGLQTLETLKAKGMNFEAHVDDEKYGHFEIMPYAIRWLTNLLKRLTQNTEQAA